jgi:hypothetical protein
VSIIRTYNGGTQAAQQSENKNMAASVESLKAKIDDTSENGFKGNLGSVKKSVAKAKALSVKEKQDVVDYAVKKFGGSAAEVEETAPKKPRVAKPGKAEASGEPKKRGRPPGTKNKKAAEPEAVEEVAPTPRAPRAVAAQTVVDTTPLALELRGVIGEVRVAVALLDTAVKNMAEAPDALSIRAAVVRDISAAVQNMSGTMEQSDIISSSKEIIKFANDTLQAAKQKYPALQQPKSVPTA